MFRDERDSRLKRLFALGDEAERCREAKAYDAALVMEFIQLDTWAYLLRPKRFQDHTRKSFIWFVERYLRSDPDQTYRYNGLDVYAARCAMLHTFGSLTDIHAKDKSVVAWRYHSGTQNTFVPGLHRMAYVSSTDSSRMPDEPSVNVWANF
jgi:hypothetical protein